MNETKRRFFKDFVHAVAGSVPKVLKRQRWFGSDQTVDFFGLLHSTHGLLKCCFPSSAPKPEAAAPDVDGDEDGPPGLEAEDQDEYTVIFFACPTGIPGIQYVAYVRPVIARSRI